MRQVRVIVYTERINMTYRKNKTGQPYVSSNGELNEIRSISFCLSALVGISILPLYYITPGACIVHFLALQKICNSARRCQEC